MPSAYNPTNTQSPSSFAYGAKAYRATTVQSIPAATTTKLQLNAENWDFANEYDLATNYRYTATTAGYYIVSFAAFFATTESGKFYSVFPIKNGGSGFGVSEVQSGSTSEICPSGTGMVYLGVGDYIELFVYHNSVAAKNLSIGDGNTYMTVQKMQ